MATKNEEKAMTKFDYGADAGAGFENVETSDYNIPFLNVLQDLSPPIKERREGAELGKFWLTSTDLFLPGEEGVVVVPSKQVHLFTEQTPGDRKFRGTHALDSDVVLKAKAESQEFGKFTHENGNDLIETYLLFLTLINKGKADQCVMRFKSTFIKGFKSFLSKSRNTTTPAEWGKPQEVPMWGAMYKMKTWLDTSNSKGDFYNIRFDYAGDKPEDYLINPASDLYHGAKAFADFVSQDKAKVNFEQADGGESSGEGEGNVKTEF